MVHISLPPEPPAAVTLTVASVQKPTQAYSPTNHSSTDNHPTNSQTELPADLLERLLAPLTQSESPSFQPSVASLLAQQAESDLPALEPAFSEETAPEEAVPEETAPENGGQLNSEPADNGPETSDPVIFDLPGASPTEATPRNTEDTRDREDPPTSPDSVSNEDFASALQLSADVQEFDPVAQTVTARGNVILQLNDAIIETDELWVNLLNRYALAEGDVLLTRGAQLIEGRRLEYNFIQQSGVIGDATGTLYLPAIEEDFASPLAGISSSRRAYDPINRNPDLQVANDSNLLFGTRLSTQPSTTDDTLDDTPLENTNNGNAQLNQLRFETDELLFDVEGWRADSVRITNDPFSPPELELRADGLLLRSISETQDELLLRRPRLVFDQGISVPLLRSRILLSRGGLNPEDLNPVPVPIGIDGRDRGGVYLGRKIPIITNEKVRFSVTPQYFIGRAFSGENGSPFSWQNFGATSEIEVQLSPRTTLRGGVDITSFDLPRITENLRATLTADQQIGDHRLSLQYGYRERLFNGSLGFQDVQSSIGAVLLSPNYTLGDTGIGLTYQASAQLINAESDRQSLLTAQNSQTGRISAARYQGSVALQRGFSLWSGKPKPATPEEGLRFTPQPVVPFVGLGTGIRTTLTAYSTGDVQNSLLADISLTGQFGHLTRDFGDYTLLSASYSQSFIGDATSPFLFDREVDRNVLTLGIVQQIYGPLLGGFQTAISFDGGGAINNIYSLEYSRRTYGLLLRYDTVQNIGSIGFRLSNFRWIGDTNPFDTPRIRRVQGGVIEAR